jgi:UDP-glucuronate decarboxylase
MTRNKIIREDLASVFNADIDWRRFTNKTVLISGAGGFLPAYMVEALLFANLSNNINLKVVALVRNIQKAKKRFEYYLDNESLILIEQDVCDTIKINNVQNIDFIIHAASQASPKYYGIDPVGTLGANVLGTINLLNLARKNNVESFLYFSSGEVYGQIDDNHNPVKEDYYGYLDPMNLRSCYAESKRMGENICVSYLNQYGINIKVVRPFHTYGPGMHLNDGRVYADFVANIINGQDIDMKSDGSAKRAFCYLKDATIAFFLVLLNGVPGEAYNVGNPQQEYSIFELAETLVKMRDIPLKVNKISVSYDRQYLKSPLLRNIPNIDKLSALGWVPETSVFDGFKRTIDSYLI